MITVELDQTRLKGGQRLPQELLKRVLRRVSKELGDKQKRVVSVVFVSPREMRQLNKQYRKKDSVTDVLSFPLGGVGEDPFGEIVLLYEQAKKQAFDMKHSVRDEIVFLLVHGLLHLFGYDHLKQKDADKMFALQTKILKKLKIDSRI